MDKIESYKKIGQLTYQIIILKNRNGNQRTTPPHSEKNPPINTAV